MSGTTTSNSDNKTTTQINYGPSGGTQTIQHSTSSDSDGNQHFFPPPNDPGEGPTDVPTGSGPEESSTTVKSDVGSQDGSKPDRAAPVAAGPQAMPAGVKGKPLGKWESGGEGAGSGRARRVSGGRAYRKALPPRSSQPGFRTGVGRR